MRSNMSSGRSLPDADLTRFRIRGNIRPRSRSEGFVMTFRKIAIAALLITTSLVAAVEPPDADYLKSFEKWKAELVDGRKQHWLPLAGLFWLKPGESTFGSAPDNAIVLPSGPAHAGVFERQDKAVIVQLQSGVEAKIDGKVASESK